MASVPSKRVYRTSRKAAKQGDVGVGAQGDRRQTPPAPSGPPAPAAGDGQGGAAGKKITATYALINLLWSQIKTHCAAAEAGEDHNTLYLKLAKAPFGKKIDLTEAERRELWSVCDYIDECWDDNPTDRRLARAWRDRVALPTDRRSA